MAVGKSVPSLVFVRVEVMYPDTSRARDQFRFTGNNTSTIGPRLIYVSCLGVKPELSQRKVDISQNTAKIEKGNRQRRISPPSYQKYTGTSKSILLFVTISPWPHSFTRKSLEIQWIRPYLPTRCGSQPFTSGGRRELSIIYPSGSSVNV